MKILQVVPSLSPRTGGPAKAALELSEELALQGEEVTIFSTDHGFEENSRPLPIGVTVQAPPRHSEPRPFGAGRRISKCEILPLRFAQGQDDGTKRLPIGRGFEIQLFKYRRPRSYFYSPDLREALEREIRAFDVVHIHGLWLYPTFIASRICQKKRVPYLIRPCGMLDSFSLAHHAIRKNLYRFFIEDRNLREAEAIHFTSEEERRRAGVWGSNGRAVVVPLGINVDDDSIFPPAGEFRKRFQFLQGKKIVLFLGRVNFKKGLDLLIDAFAQVAKEVTNVHCVIAGPDDEGYGRKVRGWIEKKEVKDRVTMTGFVEGKEKLALFRASNIFCLPSHQENFGMAVVEAMSAGLPVVVSDQVALHKEIQNCEAGIVTRCEAKEIAAALFHLLKDESLRKRMGANGRELVQEKYQWEKISQEMIQLYESLAHGH